MEKDLTAFIEECKEKGGFTIIGFYSGTTKGDVGNISVEYMGEKLAVKGSLIYSFEELEESVKVAYIDFVKRKIHKHKFAAEFWETRLEKLTNVTNSGKTKKST